MQITDFIAASLLHFQQLQRLEDVYNRPSAAEKSCCMSMIGCLQGKLFRAMKSLMEHASVDEEAVCKNILANDSH